MRRFRLGFVGAGNMAEAICRAVVQAGVHKADQIVAYDVSEKRRRVFRDELKVSLAQDNASVTAGSDMVILAVKPQQFAEVLDEIRSSVSSDQLIVSIAAGFSTSFIQTGVGKSAPIVRVMPNTPLFVGCGMTAIVKGATATDEHVAQVSRIFAASGLTVNVPESRIDAITALSGSGPAYFFYVIEAMVQAGVDMGLPRSEAVRLAAQTCLGAGRMVLQTQAEPEELRRRVTSPGGTTEAAFEVLEADGVKRAFVEAVKAAAQKSRQLGR